MDNSPEFRPTPEARLGGIFDFRAAFADLYAAIKKWPIWMTLSWIEFNSTYRRSVFGIAWVVISFAAFVGIKLTIFSSLLETEVPGYYDAFLVLGFFSWYYLSPTLISAPDTFVLASGWIRSEALPYSLYILKTVMREFYNFLLTSLVAVPAVLVLSIPVSPVAFLCLFAIALYLWTAFFVKLLLGVIGARFRDLSHLVRAVMLPMMFLTPIFWMPSQMPGLMKYLWWNPLYHYIEVLRAPILDGSIPFDSWIFCAIFSLSITVISMTVFACFKRRIVYWF